MVTKKQDGRHGFNAFSQQRYLKNYDIFRSETNFTFKARRGSGFYEIFCIFANMSCLCIHLVTFFNLPGKKKIVMEFFFLCRKISFFRHPKVFISVK